ncbi:MAG: glycosyltransferase family 2 protein, partial [Clostridia bacterium]|nr:glycosyltransferase family 2 protein [Clostridia bacterium]
MDYKTVSVVVPILNEEKYIKKCLDSLLEQDYPKEKMEILLVDGGSTDGTPDIVAQYTQKYTYMKTVENPKKTVQYAMNVGIENASGYYIVRMDAHAEYANDYISKCVEYSEKTGAENVGGTTVVRGKSPVQKIIAASYHSPFALGGSRHYDESYEGYADTVAWGTFKRETLLKLGMYDERL